MSGNYTRKLWLWPIVFIYILVLAEIFIRVFSPVVLTPRYVVDSGYGIRGNWPGISYKHYSQEYGNIYFSVNKKGVRSSKEFEYEKPNNTFRVVALGDSFTMGYGAQEDQTFLANMEKSLKNNSDCKFEVINMGVSGHGTAEELVALKREGYKYQPDMVLVQWHSSDLKENIRSKLFHVEDGVLKKRRDKYLPAVGIREKLFNIAAYRYLAANSMFYSWIRREASRLVKSSMDKKTITQIENKPNEINNHELRCKKQKQLAIKLLNEIKQVSEKMGAQFLILDVPRKLDRVSFESSFPENSSLENFVYNPITDFEKNKGEILYLEKSAGHFSILGNSIVGKGLADRATVNCSLR